MTDNSPCEDILICPNCFSEHDTPVDFCKECGRPLGNFVNYDPIKRIWSQGWMYRKSLSEPSSPIIFYGIWILFGTSIILNIAFLPMMPVFAIPFIIVLAFALYKITKNYNKKRSDTSAR